jgi:prepilin-type N-terminal cleavage/methylation domain-containing protein
VKRESGFTLVELMIGMVLTSLVVAMTFQIAGTMVSAFAAQRSAYGVERNARGVIDHVGEAIRSVSVGTATGDVQDVSGCTAVQAVTVTNSTAGADELSMVYAVGGTVTSIVGSVGPDTTSFDVVRGTSLVVGDGLLLTDGVIGRMVRIETLNVDGVTGVGHVTIRAPRTACPAITTPTYAARTLAVRARVARYYIDESTGVSYLMMDPDGAGPLTGVPLAEGIEDLQIAIGVDVDGDGEIRSGGTAPDDDEWYYNVAGDSAPPPITGGRWRTVRVTVVGRELTAAGRGAISTRPRVEDRAAATAADAYRRRTLTAVIEIRNLGADK